jgi:hypothetical protein
MLFAGVTKGLRLALESWPAAMLRLRWVLALSAIVLCCVSTGAAEAGVALSPLRQQVVAKPGGTAEFALTIEYVRRRGESARTRIKLETVDFAVSPEGVLSFGPENRHARSAVEWISLDSADFVLEPGQNRKVTGKVSVPQNAEGDYWAAVLMTLGEPGHGPGVNVVLRTASGVFVRVARRHYVPRPDITALEVALPRFDEEKAPPQDSEPAGSGAQEQATPALSVRAHVSNGQTVGFIATGEARIYLNGRRNVAAIPLYARRHQILPGHERILVGLLPAPLPAGQYTVRLVVEADANPAQRAFRETTFQISTELADQWRQRAQRQKLPRSEVQPLEISQVVTAGRFTAAAVSVANRTNGTMQVRCRLEPGQLPDGWVDLDPKEFSLGPGMKRSTYCRLRIPPGAEEARYSGTLIIEAASARLADEAGPEQHEIPVHIEVKK